MDQRQKVFSPASDQGSFWPEADIASSRAVLQNFQLKKQVNKDELVRADWATAKQIAEKFPNKKCLEAAAALAKRFRADVTVLFVNTTPYAIRPFIVHTSLPDDIISETGLHFAVELHGRIFDNLTPKGARKKKWMQAFGFAAKNFEEATFSDVEIARWTYQEFLSYLKSVGRTPLGRARRTATPLARALRMSAIR